MRIKSKLILIGASTGGPGHIRKIISGLESSSCIMVIAQHMNPLFINSFTKQLNDEFSFNILLADSEHKLDSSSIYICAKHCEFLKMDLSLYLKKSNNITSSYNPNIDHLFLSAVKLCKDYNVLAILLTGIGQDGALGLSDLKNAGAICIAESQESAIVYGMPKKAIELNSNIEVMPLNEIKKYINRFGA